MFALGLLSWMYTRPPARPSLPAKKFAQTGDPRANVKALAAGVNYGETTEEFAHRMPWGPRPCRPAPTATSPATPRWRSGWSPASHRSGLPLVLGYPDHPGLRHPAHLSSLKRHGVTTMQAEDEIAGIGMALGASFGGALGVTSTSRSPVSRSRPRPSGLAVSTRAAARRRRRPARRPVDRPAHQDRAGRPAAGDVRAQWRSPVPIVAPADPGDCFDAAMEAVRIATTYGRPVFLLSDGYLPTARSRGGCPVDLLPDLDRGVRHRAQRR